MLAARQNDLQRCSMSAHVYTLAAILGMGQDISLPHMVLEHHISLSPQLPTSSSRAPCQRLGITVYQIRMHRCLDHVEPSSNVTFHTFLVAFSTVIPGFFPGRNCKFDCQVPACCAELDQVFAASPCAVQLLPNR